MGGAVDNTSAANFIPEHWSDEVRAAYEKSLVLAPCVKKLSMQGKKGDTIHIPAPSRGTANAKAEGTAVTIQNATEGEVQVVIDKHFEYSRFIEDITDTQALNSLRKFYTSDAGYALARQVDTDLFVCGTGLGDGTYAASPTPADWVNTAVYWNDASTGVTAFAENTVAAADVFEDDAFRELIQKMDDADVPMDGRIPVIPPAVGKSIMGLERHVSCDFVGGRSVVSGMIGNVYGVDIYMSRKVRVIDVVANNSASSADITACLFSNKEALVIVA